MYKPLGNIRAKGLNISSIGCELTARVLFDVMCHKVAAAVRPFGR